MSNSTPTNKKELYGERIIKEAEMICFPNPNNQRNYEVEIVIPEFTCKCPFSGYPDFATLNLFYQPNKKVVELKSLKLYINSFRDVKISHEEVTNKIVDDIVDKCNPKWIKLEADFNPRGNVHMKVKVEHGQKNN